MPEAIEHGLGALERADLGRRGVHDASCDRIERGFGGQARDLDVAEAVVGEARLEGFFGIGAKGVAVGLGRAPEVGGVDHAIGVEHLGVVQGDGVAGLGAQMHAAPADHVLAEIEDVHAGLGLRDGDGLDGAIHAHGLVGLGDQGRARRVTDADWGPRRAVEAGDTPTGGLASCVVGFAVHDVVAADRTVDRAAP